MCCSPWSCKESNLVWQLNDNTSTKALFPNEEAPVIRRHRHQWLGLQHTWGEGGMIQSNLQFFLYFLFLTESLLSFLWPQKYFPPLFEHNYNSFFKILVSYQCLFPLTAGDVDDLCSTGKFALYSLNFEYYIVESLDSVSFLQQLWCFLI